MPIQLSEPDLREARLIVAVCEHEHRPQLVEQFPAWAERVEYWAVDDLHATAADVAMHTLDEHVEALIARLEQERQRTLRRAE
jgi:protein-tyrosine phosphatase